MRITRKYVQRENIHIYTNPSLQAAGRTAATDGRTERPLRGGIEISFGGSRINFGKKWVSARVKKYWSMKHFDT